jgi:hypothetical protein
VRRRLNHDDECPDPVIGLAERLEAALPAAPTGVDLVVHLLDLGDELPPERVAVDGVRRWLLEQTLDLVEAAADPI